jgi:hypothetical protein
MTDVPERGQYMVPSAAPLPERPKTAPQPPPPASGRLPGGPVRSGRRILSDPQGRYEVTFDPDITDAEIEEIKARLVAGWAKGGARPAFYRFDHDEPWNPISQPEPSADRWGIWPLVLALAVMAAVIGLAVEVWR